MSKPWNFKGQGMNYAGYKWIHKPDHPFTNGMKHVWEHRLIWEKFNKAVLLPWGIVHHKNDVKTDNRIENLEAMMRYQHNFIHKLRKDMSDRVCSNCGNKTVPSLHKNGSIYYGWYKDGKGGWICRYCRRHPNRVIN